MNSEKRSNPNSVTTEYETTLGYLEYEENSNRLSIPIQLRERHLTLDTDSAELQAIGPELQIAIQSERDTITIRIPLDRWRTSKAYNASLSGANKGLVYVGRFEDEIASSDDGVPATIQVHSIGP